MTGRIANRPVQKHEEEVVVTDLAKTSLLVPNNTDTFGGQMRNPTDTIGSGRAWHGKWDKPGKVGQVIGLTTVRSVQTRLKSSATVSRYLSRRR